MNNKIALSIFLMIAMIGFSVGVNAQATTGSLVVSTQTTLDSMTVAIQVVNEDGGEVYAVFTNGVLKWNWTAGTNEQQRSFYTQLSQTTVFDLYTGATMTLATNGSGTLLDSYTVNTVGIGEFIPQNLVISIAIAFLLLFLVAGLVVGLITRAKARSKGD